MTLTEQELEKIKSMHGDFVKAKIALGDIELTKQDMLKQIESMRKEFEENEKQLIEKYGKDAIINIKTGEIKNK
jgi:hypothetical protein